jgi:hypothetical protein
MTMNTRIADLMTMTIHSGTLSTMLTGLALPRVRAP